MCAAYHFMRMLLNVQGFNKSCENDCFVVLSLDQRKLLQFTLENVKTIKTTILSDILQMTLTTSKNRYNEA